MSKRNISFGIGSHLSVSLALIWTNAFLMRRRSGPFAKPWSKAGVVATLVQRFEALLAAQGLQPRGGQLLDASLVPVPKQRNTRDENAAIKAGTPPAEWEVHPAKRRQKDTDARWTLKHKENHYGYKNHVNGDKQHKLIRRYEVTDAAVHDRQALEALLQPASAWRGVWADSAYRSQEAETKLTFQGLHSHIQKKGYRDKPVTAKQRVRNRMCARIRASVEHVFGHQMTAMGGTLI